MGDNSYTFAVARIRVKERTLLKDDDISQLIAMKDAPAVLAWLTDRGWGDPDGGKDAEDVLAAEEEKTWQLMRELKIDPEIFDILEFPKRFHNLKAAIKEVCTEGNHEGIFYDLERLGKDEILRVIRDKSFSSLPEYMKSTAANAYEIMVSTRDGQRCDIIVDKGCLEAMAREGQHLKDEMVRNYVESQVAVADVRIAVRAAKMGKPITFLREALADCRAFSTETLAQAASRGEEALYAYLQDHGYADAVEAISESPSAFERWCDNSLMDQIRPQKRKSFTVGPLIAYYLARENEIRMARIILTAKANGFSEDMIRERVRKMYV